MCNIFFSESISTFVACSSFWYSINFSFKILSFSANWSVLYRTFLSISSSRVRSCFFNCTIYLFSADSFSTSCSCFSLSALIYLSKLRFSYFILTNSSSFYKSNWSCVFIYSCNVKFILSLPLSPFNSVLFSLWRSDSLPRLTLKSESRSLLRVSLLSSRSCWFGLLCDCELWGRVDCLRRTSSACSPSTVFICRAYIIVEYVFFRFFSRSEASWSWIVNSSTYCSRMAFCFPNFALSSLCSFTMVCISCSLSSSP